MTERLTRRDLLRRAAAGGALIGGLGASRAGAAPEAGTRPPNIVFILADDLGYGDLGCYGQRQIRTPRIDRMAAEGLRFTQCYAGSTVCAPSRCALMTGLHTGHCFVRGNKRIPLRPEDTTVAELLRGGGYATGLAGKWGLGNEDTTGTPNRKGFSHFFGYLDQQHAHDYYPEHLWRNDTRFPLAGNRSAAPFAHGEKGVYAPDLLTIEALAFVERHRDQPFFLYWSMIRPHAANEAGRHHGEAGGEGMPVPTDAPYTETGWPQPQKNHAAMITQLDRDVGRLLDLLEELGIAQDTLVVFSSDNGPHREGGADPEFFQSAGPLRGIKRDLYEGGIRVPCVARWPGRIAPGQTSDHVWAFWDFLPTAAALAGVAAPPGLDGVSIAPTLLGQPEAQRAHTHLYWEFHEGGFKQAVRVGPWKLVRPGTGAPAELYHLGEDPGERDDRAGAAPEVVAELLPLFATSRTDSEAWPVPRGRG